MNSIAHEITGDRIIGPMIDLSACAKTDRTLVVGSKALELMLEMQRRGFNDTICLGLLETGMVGTVAGPGRRHHRTPCRN